MKQLHKKQALEVCNRVDLMDQARDCCRNIATVAALLENYGSHPGAAVMGGSPVANSGMMINRETAKLRSLVDALDHALFGLHANRKRASKTKKET